MHPQVDDETLERAYTETYGPLRSAPTAVERIGELLAQPEADRLAAVADADSTLIDLAGRGAFLRRIQRAGGAVRSASSRTGEPPAEERAWPAPDNLPGGDVRVSRLGVYRMRAEPGCR
jgi:hypothetical protein